MKHIFFVIFSIMLTSCHGLFGSVFDSADDIENPPTIADTTSENTIKNIIIDATNWNNWYYINLSGDNENANVAYPIPRTLSGEWDGKSEMVTNLYDVYGQGLSVWQEQSRTKIDTQTEPQNWDIAIHRDNVRTNDGAALETDFQSIDKLPEDLSEYYQKEFTADVFDTGNVWVVQDQMLQGIVGAQAININKVLSKWLIFKIPPIPPAFEYNGNVFLIRLKNGKYAAIRLANYQSASGVKCYMTIEYKML